MQEKGNEFGTVTKRKRRCGPLDLVALKYACDICGVDEIVLTKIDILDDLKEIPVCVEYETFGKNFPLSNFEQSEIKPHYINLKGWNASTVGITNFAKLPSETKEYIKFIEEFTGVKISIVANGPERDAIILI